MSTKSKYLIAFFLQEEYGISKIIYLLIFYCALRCFFSSSEFGIIIDLDNTFIFFEKIAIQLN